MAGKLSFERVLIEDHGLTEQLLEEASCQSQQQKIPLSQYLIEKGILNHESLAQALAKFHQVKYQSPPLSPDSGLLSQFPLFTLRRFKIIPLHKTDKKITVVCADPGNVLAIDEIRKLTGLSVEMVCTTENAIGEILTGLQSTDSEKPREPGDTALHVETSLEHALQRRASDIHFEPQRSVAYIRERVDGILYEIQVMPLDLFSHVISRIKVLAGMDIVERRLAQDGRFSYRGKQTQCEIRASTLPTIHGEKMVLRLLRSDENKPTLEMLDVGKERFAAIQRICKLNDGLVLVAGPTGSGKTTTIYALLGTLDRKSRNLITIEDPVEYELERANQVQINPKIGITFASTLPHILRQDPDILMIGEIRDEKTAQMCLRAAITGHLVFSTVHAPNCLQTVTRLCDMGIVPHMIVAALKACISQRLLRRLCPQCKKEVTASAEDKKMLGVSSLPDLSLYEPVGCTRCHGLGYLGRFAVMEILQVSETLREAILKREHKRLKEMAVAEGFQTLLEHATKRVIAGETSLKEFLTVT